MFKTHLYHTAIFKTKSPAVGRLHRDNLIKTYAEI